MPPRSATHWLCNFRRVAPPLWASVSKGNQHLTHGRHWIPTACVSPALGEDPQPGQGAHGADSQASLTGSPPLPRPASLLLTVSEGVTESLLTPLPAPRARP